MTWLSRHDHGPDPAVDGVVWSAQREREARPCPEDTFAWVWDGLVDGVMAAADRARLAPVGDTLVDLGGGRAGLTLRLAHALGLRTWVSVDVAHGHGPTDPTRAVAPGPFAVPVPEGLEVVCVRADAVEAASRWRQVAGVVVIGGLDADVVADPAWHASLAHVVGRMLTPGSVVLWTESLAGPQLVLPAFESVAMAALSGARAGPGWLGSGAVRKR